MKIYLSLIGLCFCISIGHSQEAFKLDEKFDVENGGTLYLDTEDADINISGSDRSNASVKVYRKEEGKRYTNKDFELEFQFGYPR